MALARVPLEHRRLLGTILKREAALITRDWHRWVVSHPFLAELQPVDVLSQYARWLNHIPGQPHPDLVIAPDRPRPSLELRRALGDLISDRAIFIIEFWDLWVRTEVPLMAEIRREDARCAFGTWLSHVAVTEPNTRLTDPQ